jgi:hypothetical protein
VFIPSLFEADDSLSPPWLNQVRLSTLWWKMMLILSPLEADEFIHSLVAADEFIHYLTEPDEFIHFLVEADYILSYPWLRLITVYPHPCLRLMTVYPIPG